MTHLVRIDAPANMHRFYCARISPTLFGDWDVIREWGRIGQAGTLKIDHHASEAEAEKALNLIHAEKVKRGYKPRQT